MAPFTGIPNQCNTITWSAMKANQNMLNKTRKRKIENGVAAIVSG